MTVFVVFPHSLFTGVNCMPCNWVIRYDLWFSGPIGPIPFRDGIPGTSQFGCMFFSPGKRAACILVLLPTLRAVGTFIGHYIQSNHIGSGAGVLLSPSASLPAGQVQLPLHLRPSLRNYTFTYTPTTTSSTSSLWASATTSWTSTTSWTQLPGHRLQAGHQLPP